MTSDQCFEYCFGFNGKEQDNEVSGSGNSYDYGFRIYNPRLGRFLSVDPLTKSYPWYTPYQFAGNKPIVAIDLDGLEEFVVSDALNDPKYMGKMWDIIKSSEILMSQYAAVTLASKKETHKIYNIIVPKSLEGEFGANAYTIDEVNIKKACQLVLDEGDKGGTQQAYFRAVFAHNGLDASIIMEELDDKEVAIVALNESQFERDEYGGFASYYFMHEIVAHVKNKMTGVSKSEDDEHYEYHKESDKSEEDNEVYRSEFSPPANKLYKSKSLAGKMWREVLKYMETKDAEKPTATDVKNPKDTTDSH